MFPIKTAVLRQIAFANSVREFIRDLVRRLVPGDWLNTVISASDAAFSRKLETAFRRLDERTAREGDYREGVVSVLCEEVARLCESLKAVCEGCGYDKYAHVFLAHDRFIRMVSRVETEKLEALKEATSDRRLKGIDLLRAVGAAWEGRDPAGCARLGPSDRRQANKEIRDIGERLRRSIEAVGAKVDAVSEGVAGVGAKVDGLRRHGKGGRGSYSAEQMQAVQDAWRLYNGSGEARRADNKRPNYKAAFGYAKAALLAVGIEDVKAFAKVMHAAEMRAARKRDRARQTQKTPKTKTRIVA